MTKTTHFLITILLATGISSGARLAGADLSVVHSNAYPTRLAQGPEGKIYVTDARADALFIYDAKLDLMGQLKGLDRPLGVAVGTNGVIYVGNDGIDRLTAYDAEGTKMPGMGRHTVKMPNDLAMDRMGRVYVVDSLSDRVWICDSAGCPVGSFGVSSFPVALAIAYRSVEGEEVGEVFVAEQRFGRIQVFDLEGNFMRAFGGKSRRDWQGKSVRIQSLAVDGYGRLHVADSFMNKVQILDVVTGNYIDSYGSFGSDPGKLRLPLDILIRGNEVIAANAENGRVEVIYTIP